MYTILAIDDIPSNIDIIVETLADEYIIQAEISGAEAIDFARKNPPDLILLDIMMPEMDGFEVLEKLNSQGTTRQIPVIFLTALTDDQTESKGLAMGAVDYITKPLNPDILRARVKNQLELKQYRDQMAGLVRERTRDLICTRNAIIVGLSVMAESRNQETTGHLKRTKKYIKALALHIKTHPRFKDYLDYQTIEFISKSAPLHDIGKVGVKDEILQKPGSLTSQEFEVQKNHTIWGAETIILCEQELRGTQDSFLRFSREIALTHHERWDGKGYPQGLTGDNIPVTGRLMAIVDVYDALISKRIYKAPVAHKDAVRFMAEERGGHFDPDMVDGFLEINEECRQIALKFADYEDEIESLMQYK